jgi:hypothetical protein
MSLRAWRWVAFLGAILWALVVFILLALAELPAGMHRACEVRVDTVLYVHQTPSRAWLDSMARADSLEIDQKTYTMELTDNPRVNILIINNFIKLLMKERKRMKDLLKTILKKEKEK